METKESTREVLKLLKAADPKGLDIDFDSCELDYGIPGNNMQMVLDEFEKNGLIRQFPTKGSTYVFPTARLYEYEIV